MAQRFRPEIQGLRALAVTLVVLYHLHPGLLPGGFVGVDVFFVISGFLITGQLLGMARRPGGLSLTAFWAGRIRRLLPAASVVLAACLAATLALVPPALWQRTVLEIGASALYVQNWALAGSAVDYLAGDDAPTLVQHFWSLSVEEQFYLVWPLLLLAALALRRRRAVLVALGLVVAASLAHSVATGGAAGSYFDTGTRAWEFGVGGMLAAAPSLGRRLAARPVLSALASWLGGGLVLVAALAFSGTTPFPGVAAVLPVLGTALAIAAGPGAVPWAAGRLAAAAPVQLVGGLSYSLYLWHWPLIVLLGYVVGGDPGLGPSMLLVAVALGLSWLTKRYVEDPPRRAPVLRRQLSRTYAVAIAAIAVLVVGSGVTWTAVYATTAASARAAVQQFETDACYGAGAMRSAGCDSPFSAEGVDTAFAAQDRGVLAEPCNAHGSALRTCEFGQTESPAVTVAVVGNSHAAALVPGLVAYGENRGWRILLLRKTDCLGVSTLPLPQPAGSDCTEWTEAVHERVQRDDVDVVVFGTHRNAMHYLADPVTPDEDVAALQPHISETFAALVAAGKGVVVVGDTPGTGSRSRPAPECVYLNRFDYDPCATSEPTGKEDGNIESIAARSTPGVEYLSLLPSVCDVRCHVVIGGAVVYFDDHHLSASFSRSLAPELGGAVLDALQR